MTDMIEVTTGDIDIEEAITKVREKDHGAVVSFLGTVRSDPGVVAMEIEGDVEACVDSLDALKDRTKERFGVGSIAITMSTGSREVGDMMTFMAVGAPHREDAFEACKYLIDEIKEGDFLQMTEVKR